MKSAWVRESSSGEAKRVTFFDRYVIEGHVDRFGFSLKVWNRRKALKELLKLGNEIG